MQLGFILEADERVMLAMARIDEKVGLSTKNRASQDHPPLKMKLPSRVERKCGEWCEVQSKTKKKIYYLNIRTKETTWKKPPGWCDKTVSQLLMPVKIRFWGQNIILRSSGVSLKTRFVIRRSIGAK